MLFCTEVSSWIFSAIAAHLNKAACTQTKLQIHVAQNLLHTELSSIICDFPCLDPCRRGEDKKATWEVVIWKVGGEKAELSKKG